MKKTINGIRYNTDTSIAIGTHEHGTYVTDFDYWCATLYKMPRSNRFFIYGRGGPMTRFAVKTADNSISSGEKLIPVKKVDALQFAMTYLDDIDNHFDDMIQDV